MKKYVFCRITVLVLALAMLVPAFPVFSTGGFPFVAYTFQNTPMKSSSDDNAAEVMQVPIGSAVAVIGEESGFYIVIYEGKTGYILKESLLNEMPDLPKVDTSDISKEELASYANYTSLSEGSSGDSVKALQGALKELGFHSGKVDGKFGPATKKSVSSFQKKNKLTATGIADAQMQHLLFEGKPLNSRGKKTQVKTLAVSAEVLRPGDKGIPVENLQKRLKELGYHTGKIDGKYGRNTEKSVRAFQKDNKLKVDGKAGQKTQEALYNSAALPKGATPTPRPVVPTDAPQDSSGNNDYPDAPFPDTNAEPVYPYNTTTNDSVNLRKRASVRSTRLATVPNGASIEVIKTSGDFLYISYKSRKGYVMAQYVNIPEQYLPGESFKYDSEARVRYETLAKGVSGSLVKTLQQALKELGFFNKTEDGVYGSDTITAVKDFQTKNGYKATGVALPEMQKLIYEGKPRNSKNRKIYVDILPPIPNPDMQIGDKGDAVADLQQTLTTLGFYKGEIDGVYGRSTSNAVKAYQKAHSIRQTGKMNKFTWLSLEANMQTPSPGNSGPQYELNESNVIVMRKGTRGLAVTRLEERLIELGYYDRTPNGIYENQDMDAVRQFQRNNGFTSSGIADLYTQRALFSENALPASKNPPGDWQSIASPAPTTFVPTPPPVYALLKIGSKGSDVTQLQNRLKSLGYLTGKADGIYGTQTALAVTSFQKANNLKADGMAGQDTLTALYSNNAVAQTPGNNTQQNQGNFTRNLRMGTRGEDVAAAQRRLISLKYLSGAADGIFGPATALAVRSFQESNSLKQDGIVGSLTWAKLHSGNAVAKDNISIIPPVVPGTNNNNQNNVQPPAFTAPRAKEVRFALWDNEVRAHSRKLPDVIVYDFLSGGHYNVNVFSNGNHAEAEPVTREDTETMRKLLGKDNWTPRPVWIMFSDGRVYMASTHSRGHEVDHNPNNGLSGHICIHYPREMSVAEKVGPYAVSHQNAILAGWDLTQSMAVKE